MTGLMVEYLISEIMKKLKGLQDLKDPNNREDLLKLIAIIIIGLKFSLLENKIIVITENNLKIVNTIRMVMMKTDPVKIDNTNNRLINNLNVILNKIISLKLTI